MAIHDGGVSDIVARAPFADRTLQRSEAMAPAHLLSRRRQLCPQLRAELDHGVFAVGHGTVLGCSQHHASRCLTTATLPLVTTGVKDVSTDSEQVLMSALRQQPVLEAGQSFPIVQDRSHSCVRIEA